MAAGGAREVVARVVTSLVLAACFGAALYFGWPYFNAIVLIAIGLMAWEWAHLSKPAMGVASVLLIALVLAAGALATFEFYLAGLATAAGGGIAVYAAARIARRSDALWLAVGSIYLGGPVVSLLWLLTGLGDGRWLVFWVIAAVAATDIGAYIVGRAVGGPKLAPRLSPGKTWAGLGGGMAAAALFAAVYAYLTGYGLILCMALAGAGLAVVAQAGDLFESLAKRRFQVKDASRFLPGHGGFLDRADGLVAAAVVVAGVKLGIELTR